MKKANLITAAACAILVAVSATSAAAGTLENLERERAITLSNLISDDLSPIERQDRLRNAKPRLVDLERMVMRDPSLKGKNTPDVSRAFGNYDMTFLMHASVEKDRTVIDHWFEQMGVTTSSLMSASVGRR